MNTVAAVQRECASFVEKLRPAEEVQESEHKRCGKLFGGDENGDDRSLVCTLCDEVIMSGTDMILLDPDFKEEQRTIYVERACVRRTMCKID
jgi:hypothetical protein